MSYRCRYTDGQGRRRLEFGDRLALFEDSEEA